MKPWDHPPLACPFCQGRANRIAREERRAQAGVRGKVGQLLALEFAFWPVVVALFALSLWSLVAGAVALLGAAGFYICWERRRATFRCEACQTVLTYREVMRAKEPEA